MLRVSQIRAVMRMRESLGLDPLGSSCDRDGVPSLTPASATAPNDAGSVARGRARHELLPATADPYRSAPSSTPSAGGSGPGAGDTLSARSVSDGAPPRGPGDAPSLKYSTDAPGSTPSPGDGVAAVPERRLCGWCDEKELGPYQLLWCSKLCRQSAFRARRLAVVEDLGDTPKRLKYADPPYPGCAHRLYRNEPTYAGEVDHVALVASLEASSDGWALSTNEKSLQYVLSLCPPGVRVGAWVKPKGVSSRTRGPHNSWEPVIYKPARLRRPGVRDFLVAQPARGGGTLPGRKPVAFCMWLFQLLGAAHVDQLEDLYPGTRVVTRSWRQFQAVGREACRG